MQCAAWPRAVRRQRFLSGQLQGRQTDHSEQTDSPVAQCPNHTGCAVSREAIICVCYLVGDVGRAIVRKWQRVGSEYFGCS